MFTWLLSVWPVPRECLYRHYPSIYLHFSPMALNQNLSQLPACLFVPPFVTDSSLLSYILIGVVFSTYCGVVFSTYCLTVAFFRSARTSWNMFVRPPVRKKNLDQLNSSINHHRTTANLSDIVWCMSGGVWWCLDYVWWCLVVSDACLVVSGDVNVYRLI